MRPEGDAQDVGRLPAARRPLPGLLPRARHSSQRQVRIHMPDSRYIFTYGLHVTYSHTLSRASQHADPFLVFFLALVILVNAKWVFTNQIHVTYSHTRFTY